MIRSGDGLLSTIDSLSESRGMTSHATVPDPRNEQILIYVNGDLVARHQAVVSVFDSGFLMGDGVWEGLRLHNAKLALLAEHIDRLYEGAKAIDLDVGLTKEELASAMYRTTEANGMISDVHLRVMVTRGLKSTPFQGPSVNVGGPTLVIIAEHKTADPSLLSRGLDLFTVHVRRGAPDVQDPRWNSHSKLNCIAACIQAEKAGADEALMLDPHGFVATCNSTNFFVVKRGEVWTSTGRYCLHGITRAKILEVARASGLAAFERDFTLTDVYASEEAFVTGTFGGVTPVRQVDGRRIGAVPGPITLRLRQLYLEWIEREHPP
jgi:branched-chain amino acid aminotransferase